jgi:hypothetical protein
MRAGPAILLIAGAACLALAVADQLTSGDLYGRGSSLRTDREGSSVFFTALTRTHVQVDRNYAPLNAVEAKDGTIFLLGISPGALRQSNFTASITTLAKAGNRIVLAMDDAAHWDLKLKDWGLEVHTLLPEDDDDDEEYAWPAYFTASGDWRIIRAEEVRAHAIERTFGAGTVALIASTRPLLNLALRDDRDIQLLEWAAGSSQRIIFDESHLGSMQSGTIMGLVRELRLRGLLAALIAASLLYFWRASVPFPPVQELPDGAALKLFGSGSDEALRNLLERRIPPSALIPACIQEWTRDFARREGPAAVTQVTETAAGTATPAEQWEQIRTIVRKARIHD